jgi:two-component system cell cycle response regulator
MPNDLQSQLGESYSVLHSIPNGVCIIDDGFTVVFWNQCIESWTGINQAEALGEKIYDVVHKFKAPQYKIRIQSLFSGGPPVIFSSQLHPKSLSLQ